MRPHGRVAAGGPPFLVIHGGEQVPALLEAWVAWHGQRALRLSDAEGLAALAAAITPAGAAIAATPELIAAWREACPDGPAPWLVLDRPDPAAVALALDAAPAGLLSAPPAAVLVEGWPATPAWETLAARARALLGPDPVGRHAEWAALCLGVGDARPAARRLMAPLLHEHLERLGVELARHDHGEARALDLAPLLAGAAAQRAAGAARHGVRLVLGPAEGELAVVPGTFLKLLDQAIDLLMGCLPPGGRLIVSGDAAGVTLARDPGADLDAVPPDPAPEDAAALLAAARAAGVVASLDDAPWAALALRVDDPACPRPLARPRRLVLVEPDPFVREWARSQPGGRWLDVPAWEPGRPWPPEALAPGAWVVVDDAIAEDLRRAAPAGAPAPHRMPLRAAFGHGGVRFPAPIGPRDEPADDRPARPVAQAPAPGPAPRPELAPAPAAALPIGGLGAAVGVALMLLAAAAIAAAFG